jgi:hypothetical protein
MPLYVTSAHLTSRRSSGYFCEALESVAVTQILIFSQFLVSNIEDRFSPDKGIAGRPVAPFSGERLLAE